MSEGYQSVYFRVVGLRESKWLPKRFRGKMYELKIGDSPSKLVTFSELVKEIGGSSNDLYFCDSEAEGLFAAGQYNFWVSYPGGSSVRMR
ncbi:hypothetical protein [Rathayibacter toxicus]|nr:hypothetical protein [Rathayibacter toxicus]QOD08821.1 hypothetical protein AYW78_02940 [Rathayibacter toxicus]QOD10935.1 hypothetical protein BSG36_02940 [Rathayibacter toxicus]QWL25618.1 hypothetical protein E2R32_02905 [Rathayibacter toxicus]QWL29801.1 hypothetical protein E2R34_02885 [Rathayibacter toxicus]QWL50731.1 hypothetical protein E2R44_02920 [Rathayibacter toxicus]